MGSYKTSDIRNVVILGHGGVGKTSIVEAMLFNSGAVDRLGKIMDGNTIMDYDPEEIKRQFSINMAIAPLDWKNRHLNIIDTPGYFSFEGEMLEGSSIADSALIVLGGDVQVGTEKAWQYVNDNNIPRAFVVNKMNDDGVSFEKVFEKIKEKFGKTCVPLQIPIKEDRKLVGHVDIVSLTAIRYGKDGGITEIPIPDDLMPFAKETNNALAELVAESDDALMEKFFAGISFNLEEFIKGLKYAIRNGLCTPVLACAANENRGVIALADFVSFYLPSPEYKGAVKAFDAQGNEVGLVPDSDGAPVAFVFKTIADPFIGKLSMFKVMSGTIKGDTVYFNPNKGTEERFSQVFNLRGKKQIPTDALIAGDIGAVAKLASTSTNDTLCSKSKPYTMPPIIFPLPQFTMAITAKAKGDEEKINQGLSKLIEEELTFKYYTDKETGQLLISGLGNQHLEILTSKLKAKYGVSVDLNLPMVPYRETIKKKVKVQGRYKKQSGGHGQFGDVWIEFEPGKKEELEFCENVFGGSVPKNFFPAVEKGLQDSVLKGVLAGYPVVKLKATLVDGSYHPVDSSEMAFKVAAHMAFKKGIPEADPILLEPIMNVKVYVPDRYMGDIIGDLNKRRGKVLGMTPTEEGKQEIAAEVPFSEMFKYTSELRAMTQAWGTYSSDFIRYDEVPVNIAQKIIDEAKKNMVEEEL